MRKTFFGAALTVFLSVTMSLLSTTEVAAQIQSKSGNADIVDIVDPSLDHEALRVISAMPNSNPGMLKGKAVKVRCTLPVQFKLTNNVKSEKQPTVTQKDQVKHLPISKGMVGMWRQSGTIGRDGKIIEILSSNYKVLNSDGTFYTFIVWGMNRPTQIGLYGTYKITSDSTFTEQIVEHSLNPKMNNTSSELRYKMVDENTLLIEYKNEAANVWVPEIWRRVQLGNAVKAGGKMI